MNADHNLHGDIFYRNFAAILKLAESLGIYSLPAHPDKYSFTQLKKFDSIDLAECPLEHCGVTLLSVEKGLQIRDKPKKTTTGMTLVICNTQGVKKTAVLKERTLSVLIKVASQKFRAKFTQAKTPDGKLLDDPALQELADGSLVNVYK